jgi:NAD(P)-dependent dehydrogenase (short-subunit alcohol dehydrogenase family)/acyl carrier protein
VWLVTRGAEAAGGVRPDPVQAAVGGALRTFAAEEPRSFGGAIDLDGPLDGPRADLVVDTLLAAGPERRVAWRAGVPLAPRLHRTPAPQGTATVRADGSYLITGGLGALGLACADWLLERGAGRVVLTGRSELSDAGRARLAALDPDGDRLHYLRGDVSLAADATRLVRAAGDGGSRPLRGVLHAAGVLDDAVWSQQSADRFARVFAPKAAGLVNLCAALADTALDFLVPFSSVAGLLGTPSQAPYAAANAFLDAAAETLRAAGLPTTSIAWGPWGAGGMATGSAGRIAATGLQPMAPELALGALELLLPGDRAHVVVAEADWDRWSATVGGALTAGLLRDLTAADGTAAAELADAADMAGDLARRLELPPADRSAKVADDLRRRLAATTRTPLEGVPLDVPLTALGLDSLMGIELKQGIEARYGVTVPAATVLQGPTIAELAAHVVAGLVERTAATDVRATDVRATDVTATDVRAADVEPATSAGVSSAEALRLLADLDTLDESALDRLLADLSADDLSADDIEGPGSNEEVTR